MSNFKTNYGYGSDALSSRGFIDKKIILELVSQEEIFSLVFGFLPEDFQYVTSPFRLSDKSPGCWFQYHLNNTLYFIDFASNAHRRHSDCFNVVQDYFQLPNFYSTLDFIYKKLIQGKDIRVQTRMIRDIQKQTKESVKILIEPRNYNQNDTNWWKPYGVTTSQLLQDKYYAFSAFHALNTKKGNISSRPTDLAYADTNFKEGRKKLYFPLRQGKHRFLTTCRREDIGGINSLPPMGRQLIISKSYKDYRVLKNQGKNVIYLQNEGMYPLQLLLSICKSWKEVIVFFDNDKQGIHASQELSGLINREYFNKSKALWLPEQLYSLNITDPSDFHKEQGKASLFQFLNQFIP